MEEAGKEAFEDEDEDELLLTDSKMLETSLHNPPPFRGDRPADLPLLTDLRNPSFGSGEGDESPNYLLVSQRASTPQFGVPASAFMSAVDLVPIHQRKRSSAGNMVLLSPRAASAQPPSTSDMEVSSSSPHGGWRSPVTRVSLRQSASRRRSVLFDPEELFVADSIESDTNSLSKAEAECGLCPNPKIDTLKAYKPRKTFRESRNLAGFFTSAGTNSELSSGDAIMLGPAECYEEAARAIALLRKKESDLAERAGHQRVGGTAENRAYVGGTRDTMQKSLFSYRSYDKQKKLEVESSFMRLVENRLMNMRTETREFQVASAIFMKVAMDRYATDPQSGNEFIDPMLTRMYSSNVKALRVRSFELLLNLAVHGAFLGRNETAVFSSLLHQLRKLLGLLTAAGPDEEDGDVWFAAMKTSLCYLRAFDPEKRATVLPVNVVSVFANKFAPRSPAIERILISELFCKAGFIDDLGQGSDSHVGFQDLSRENSARHGVVEKRKTRSGPSRREQFLLILMEPETFGGRLPSPDGLFNEELLQRSGGLSLLVTLLARARSIRSIQDILMTLVSLSISRARKKRNLRVLSADLRWQVKAIVEIFRTQTKHWNPSHFLRFQVSSFTDSVLRHLFFEPLFMDDSDRDGNQELREIVRALNERVDKDLFLTTLLELVNIGEEMRGMDSEHGGIDVPWSDRIVRMEGEVLRIGSESERPLVPVVAVICSTVKELFSGGKTASSAYIEEAIRLTELLLYSLLVRNPLWPETRFFESEAQGLLMGARILSRESLSLVRVDTLSTLLSILPSESPKSPTKTQFEYISVLRQALAELLANRVVTELLRFTDDPDACVAERACRALASSRGGMPLRMKHKAAKTLLHSREGDYSLAVYNFLLLRAYRSLTLELRLNGTNSTTAEDRIIISAAPPNGCSYSTAEPFTTQSPRSPLPRNEPVEDPESRAEHNSFSDLVYTSPLEDDDSDFDESELD
ncbi:hypothetical protein NDN08_005599 [Rhodosorus marinus]|uniref:Uncharacterized protein n=1 Tax=Rhodosorus marinus TaxID=101924 RepID=A0AAV8V4G0_9RHOD|nr:hypothetical protein NDN08_005599 [Rhodosorus marinus]